MASELRVTTIANNAGTESVGTTYVINGSAKAWADVSSVTSVGDSLNVASLTDDGGSAPNDYTIAYTSNMGSANFSVTATVDALAARIAVADNKSASGFSLNVYVSNSVGTATGNTADFTVHGDLA
tara:strand:+ start:334 stop:711 length:378 start_codon:yes stop_codon:yes gene_type:complete